MNGDLKRLESRIEELGHRLRRLEAVVFSREEKPTLKPDPAEVQDLEQTTAPTSARRIPASAILSFVGRSLIVLGGAFLLRWLTQSQFLPQQMGSVLGMVYALLWIAMADMSAGRGQRHSSAFHGVTGALIALPLLVEATTQSHFLTPTSSAISLFAFVIIGLVVAGRRKLRILAWIVALPAAPLAFFLAFRTDTMTPFLLSILALGFVTLWLGYLRRWQFLATLMAGAANFGLALVVMEQVFRSDAARGNTMGQREALILLVGLIAVYFGSYCFRVFKRKRKITALEIGQTLTVFLIGLGGVAAVIRSGNHSMIPLGVVCLTLSGACYSAAFVFLPRLEPDRRNFLFFTLIALVMALLGGELAFGQSVAALSFTAFALIAGLVGKRITSPILYLHGAAYLVVAIVRSGLWDTIMHGFVGPSAPVGEWLGIPVLFALAVTVLYPWLPKPHGRTVDLFLGRRAVELFLFITVLAFGGIVVALIAKMIPLIAEPGAQRGALAKARTGVIALSAILLAWCSCKRRFRKLTWLVYAILVIGAIKLFFEDVAVGGASTLFLSFALYGGALILGPRFLRRAETSKSEADGE